MSRLLAFAIVVADSLNAHGWRHGIVDYWRRSAVLYVSWPRADEREECEAGAPRARNGRSWWRAPLNDIPTQSA